MLCIGCATTVAEEHDSEAGSDRTGDLHPNSNNQTLEPAIL
jgi:hypothetical protein